MFAWDIFIDALGVILIAAGLFWLISVARRDVSIVDSLWSLLFLLAGLVYWSAAQDSGARAMLVMLLLTLWSLRLSLYISWRNRGEGEDRRYQAIRERNEPGFWWKSLYLVFGLQGVIAWVISLPLLVAIGSAGELQWLDWLALALWLVGMLFEAGGDWQLARFKARPENRGQVLDQGLWRYTRHPNYFGNACIWWAFYLFALSAGGWWAILSPLLMTFLLLRVSGVTLLEADMRERRPAYRDYVARTNVFIPGPPRATASGSADRQDRT